MAVNEIVFRSPQMESKTDSEKAPNAQAEVYKLLMKTRNEFATESACSGHNVCSNKVLSVLALIRYKHMNRQSYQLL